jgi:hypothetical protein
VSSGALDHTISILVADPVLVTSTGIHDFEFTHKVLAGYVQQLRGIASQIADALRGALPAQMPLGMPIECASDTREIRL